MTTCLDFNALLRRYNPILVLYPQDPTRMRPGAKRVGIVGWGDYHPCPAEFFLARVQRRNRPKLYDINGWFRRDWRPGARTGLDELRQALAQTSPEDNSRWELDVAEIPSQNETLAWRTYGALLKEDDDPYETVVYGRWREGPSGTSLQYWYLYLYNDFGNNHEADWEMASIELGLDGSTISIGISCHHGGWKLPWDAAPKEGDRPVVYVGRGSHGGYFSHRTRGYPVVGMNLEGNLPLWLRWLAPAQRFLRRVKSRIPLLGWRDHPPAHPERDSTAADRRRGVVVQPELKIMPQGPPAADSDWWWMRYQGKWGSTHTRIAGFIGVDGPWVGGDRNLGWSDPVAWIHSLKSPED